MIAIKEDTWKIYEKSYLIYVPLVDTFGVDVVEVNIGLE